MVGTALLPAEVVLGGRKTIGIKFFYEHHAEAHTRAWSTNDWRLREGAGTSTPSCK